MTKCVYLAHPVAPTEEQIAAKLNKIGTDYQGDLLPEASRAKAIRYCVEDNLTSTRMWLKFLVDNTDWAISAPWMPYVETLNDATSSHRARGLRDDCAMAERCDAIVLTGGRISNGMGQEMEACRLAGGEVIDLTYLGPLPPEPQTDAWWRTIDKLKKIDFEMQQRAVRIGIGKE